MKSLDSSLHISAFTKKKLNSAKPVLDHLSDYVSTWFNDLKKELQSAFHAIQRDPDFRYLWRRFSFPFMRFSRSTSIRFVIPIPPPHP